MSFKAGDKVKCIDNDLAGDRFTIGGIYVISKVQSNGYVNFEHTGSISWWPDRFELIERK